MNSRDMELAAATVIATIDSPIAIPFLNRDEWVDWPVIEQRYRHLSGGEQALVDLARHLSFRPPSPQNTSFLMTLSKVDQPHRDVVMAALAALIEDDQQLREVGS